MSRVLKRGQRVTDEKQEWRPIEDAAIRFVKIATREPYDWPEPMSKELYEAYQHLQTLVLVEVMTLADVAGTSSCPSNRH